MKIFNDLNTVNLDIFAMYIFRLISVFLKYNISENMHTMKITL